MKGRISTTWATWPQSPGSLLFNGIMSDFKYIYIAKNISLNHFYFRGVGGIPMHLRISLASGMYILGENSKPFPTVPEMIDHYTQHELPVLKADRIKLLHPIPRQWLLSWDSNGLCYCWKILLHVKVNSVSNHKCTLQFFTTLSFCLPVFCHWQGKKEIESLCVFWLLVNLKKLFRWFTLNNL